MNTMNGVFDTPLNVGRGRGMLHTPVHLQFGTPAQGRGITVGDSHRPGLPPVSGDFNPSLSRPVGVSHESSDTTPMIPSPNVLATEIVSQMGDVIQQVSQRVVQDIMTQLNPPTSTPLSNAASSSSHGVPPSAMSDASHVQLVSHRKLKDPPCFRGDDSDTVSLREWEDLMRAFIRKSYLRPEEQAEEILVHLREKGENAFDYWLRLHRAVDLAAERLAEQGKTLDSPSTEVTRMFIRNCPSSELSLTFRSKTMDKWTAHEVQDILYEYHSRVASCDNKVVRENIKISTHHTATLPPPPPSDEQNPSQSQASDSATLERLINMLEKVLLQRPVQSAPNRFPGSRRPRVEGLHNMPCSVCHDATHSTFTHCRDHKLCFLCYSPNHSRRACSTRVPANPQQQEN
ncbi:uncharacterized protein LOC115392874 [Salarias fasciatus]|uniref:uncharacterized protein LOC115392874 n=1 Tax=Salarias fasciatus TaxID=181472 RepID=UPI001177030B|nr:uncharacterized protein LOC115392874 [Salarias fasciatus]